MRHAFAFVFVICAAASVIAQEPPATVNVELKVPLEAKTLKGAPYSAEIVNDYTQVLADGNRIVQHSTGRVYRDTDGRVRREEDRASGSPAISIVDPVAGVSHSIGSSNRAAAKQRVEKMIMETNGGVVGFRRSYGLEPQSESGEALAPRIVEGVSLEGR